MSLSLKHIFIRLFISLSIFVFTIYLTPNFYISNLYILFISAFFIIIVDYLISLISGIHDYPIGRGLVGFCSAVIIIYATQFFISGYSISVVSSLIAASIYSITDYLLENERME